MENGIKKARELDKKGTSLYIKHSCEVCGKKRWVKLEKGVLRSTLCLSCSKTGERNQNWKGQNVGYGALHDWVRLRKKRPLLCEKCWDKPPLDLSNISGKYLRDLSDWHWICRHCHMEIDGRLANLTKRKRTVTV